MRQDGERKYDEETLMRDGVRVWDKSKGALAAEGKREENEVMILNLNNLPVSLHIHIFHAWWPPATFLAITHCGNGINANAVGDYGIAAICSYLAEPPQAAVMDGHELAEMMCLP